MRVCVTLTAVLLLFGISDAMGMDSEVGFGEFVEDFAAGEIAETELHDWNDAVAECPEGLSAEVMDTLDMYFDRSVLPLEKSSFPQSVTFATALNYGLQALFECDRPEAIRLSTRILTDPSATETSIDVAATLLAKDSRKRTAGANDTGHLTKVLNTLRVSRSRLGNERGLAIWRLYLEGLSAAIPVPAKSWLPPAESNSLLKMLKEDLEDYRIPGAENRVLAILIYAVRTAEPLENEVWKMEVREFLAKDKASIDQITTWMEETVKELGW